MTAVKCWEQHLCTLQRSVDILHIVGYVRTALDKRVHRAVGLKIQKLQLVWALGVVGDMHLQILKICHSLHLLGYGNSKMTQFSHNSSF